MPSQPEHPPKSQAVDIDTSAALSSAVEWLPVSPWKAGLKVRCPRCAKGKLLTRMLDLRENCDICGLDYKFADAGDGPAVFVIFLLGFLMVGAALFVELRYGPPLWLHIVVWGPVTIILAIALLRPMKGVLIALQYHHKARQTRLKHEC